MAILADLQFALVGIEEGDTDVQSHVGIAEPVALAAFEEVAEALLKSHVAHLSGQRDRWQVACPCLPNLLVEQGELLFCQLQFWQLLVQSADGQFGDVPWHACHVYRLRGIEV